MKDKVAHSRGWFLKADSDLADVLTVLSDYAVPTRYDLEFWPDRETAADALGLAEQVRELVLALVSKEALP